METENFYIELMARYFSGEASVKEQALLHAWVKAQPDNKKTFNDYRQAWNLMNEAIVQENINTDSEWQNLQQKISSTPVIDFTEKTKPKALFLRIAAIITLGLISAFVLYSLLKQPNVKTVQFATNTEIKKGTLPDGSSVTLNANTRIDFPEKFNGNTRSVKLKGEAFFEVTKNKNMPFIIEANNALVEVLGTSFMVRTDSAGSVVVVVKTGMVAVYEKTKPENKVVLRPGEKTIFTPGAIVQKQVNSDVNFIAWKTRTLVFNNDSLPLIAQTLSKYYHIPVLLKNSDLRSCTLTASFENQSLESVLKIIEATLNVQIANKGTQVEIAGKPCSK